MTLTVDHRRPHRLRRAEVIDNAFEHNDRITPQISVLIEPFTRAGTDWIELTVAGNGPGIPETERRVFVEGTETPLSHGSGLGLWPTEWIGNPSYGHLSVTDNEPRGTVVRVGLRQASVDET